MNEYKTCNACLQTLPASDFYKHNARNDQLRPKCKICYNLAVKEYTQNNKEKKNAYQRQWRAKNKDKVIVYNQTFANKNPEAVKISQRKYGQNNPELVRNKSAIRRARKRNNGDFLITKKELAWLYKQPCFYCGGAAEHLDHVMPISRGGRHSIGNLVPACAKCNLEKSDRLVIEWKIIKAKEREGK